MSLIFSGQFETYRFVIQVYGEGDPWIVSGQGAAYERNLEVWGRSSYDWPFTEAGVKFPEDDGFHFVEVSIAEDNGGGECPEYGACSRTFFTRPATRDEVFGEFEGDVPPCCPDCGHRPHDGGSECSECDAVLEAMKARLRARRLASYSEPWFSHSPRDSQPARLVGQTANVMIIDDLG